MQEISRHGYPIGPGTLYPILHGLEKEKLIHSYKETCRGKSTTVLSHHYLREKSFDGCPSKIMNVLMKDILTQSALERQLMTSSQLPFQRKSKNYLEMSGLSA